VIAGRDNGFKRKIVQPTTSRFKLASPATLRNVSGYNQSIWFDAPGKAGDSVKRGVILCTEVNIRNMEQANRFGHCHAFDIGQLSCKSQHPFYRRLFQTSRARPNVLRALALTLLRRARPRTA
jgi:hypothetical protein